MVGFVVQLLLSMAAIGLAVPLLVASFLVKGFRRIGVDDVDLAQSFKIACCASVASFFFWFAVNFLMPPELSKTSSMAIHVTIIVVAQLVIVSVLVRRFTAQVLLIEAAAVLLGNAIVLAALYQVAQLVIPR